MKKRKNSKPIIGEPKKATFKRNCLLCQRYVVCRDPDKRASYACSRFLESEELSSDDIDMLFDTSRKKNADDVEKLIAEASDEESIADMIDTVLKSGVPVPPDLKMNDRHIPRPKNIYQWLTDPRFMGSEQKPFARQVQVGLTYMAEICPRCSDMDFLETMPVDTELDEIEDRIVMLEYGICPECGVSKAELYLEEEICDYWTLAGLAGQRSSKTITVNAIEGYNTCRWLVTPNLPATYNIMPSTILTSTYTAVTFGQVKNNFWTPLSTLFNTAPWFKEYHRFLTDQGRKYGEELFTLNETIIRYRHKNILMYPAAPSMRSMRGATRISAAIDEYDWFPTGKTKGNQEFERLNAVEVFKALENSLSTMRGAYLRRLKQGYSNLPKPIFSNISSPSAKNGALMTLYRQSQGSRQTYTFKYATWDFNPLLPREVFDEQFRLNPVAAERDYACNPPLGTNSWIPKLDNIDSCFTRAKNGVKVMSTRVKTRNEKMVMSSTMQVSREPKSNFQGVLTLDAGYSNNSFAFAISFPKNIPDREAEPNEDGELDFTVDVEVFAVGEVIPKPDVPISFTRMYKNVLLPICQQFNIAYVISDRWQNIKMLQDLEDASGIEYLEHRLSYSDFTDLKEAMFDGRVDLPKLEEDNKETILDISSDDYPSCFYLKPVSHLYYQLGTVQDTGASVIKGADATDDIFRCVALAYTVLQIPEVLEGLLPVDDERPAPVAIGALATRNTAGTQVQAVSGVGMSFRANGRGAGGGMAGSTNLGVVGRRR